MKQSTAFIMCFFLCSVSVYAQPKADFTADKTGGCFPIVVKFQNVSTGIDNATKYQWDLGNGSLSTLRNPA
ncbi:MAG TPA: hypothetical protein VM187_00210, partial [Niastella sp.]|nr:hypothetical protein [Niastella sp.]